MGEDSRPVWPPGGTIWAARVLGRFEVSNLDNPLPRFRSRTAFALLGYLLLQEGREAPNHRLCSTFWPDSDGDRQAQNLRRAIADLREVLENGMVRGSVVRTRDEAVTLNPSNIASDLDVFVELAGAGLRNSDEAALKEAVELYFGPVLAPLDGDWVLPRRMEAEESYSQCVAMLADGLVAKGQFREALKTGRAAVIAAPHREDVHIALIKAYRASGLESEAIRQYEELERLLDEVWGERPSNRAREALEYTQSKAQTQIPKTQPSPVRASSGGAMPVDSPLYVRRQADTDVESALLNGESTVLVHGPRQVGKTSLLARATEFSRKQWERPLFTDFQALGASQFADAERFYRTLAISLAQQLGQELNLATSWSEWLGPNMNLDAIVGKLLQGQQARVVWMIDEADRLFEQPYSDDFFGLLRSWHNRRAVEPSAHWSKLTTVISYALDAHLFIGDPAQSPFNVGVRVSLHDFSLQEVRHLNSLFGGVLTESECDNLWSLTRGQPWLTRHALEQISAGKSTVPSLCEDSSKPDGPFGDHLARLLRSATQNEKYVDEIEKGLKGKWTPNARICEKLVAGGVLVRTPEGYGFRVPFYRDFLAVSLSPSN